MASLFFGSAFAQRGLTDASGFRLTNWMLAGSLAAGIGVGVVVGLCLRHRIPPAPTSETPADARNLSWTGRLRPSTAGTIVLVCAIALTLAVGIWMWMTSGLWFVVLIGALLIPLLPLLSATVSVNADGLRVSASGVTLMRVPRERFKEAHVTTVTPLGEYGGWGPRAGFDGSWGWVTTAGEALRVSRHDTSDLVFTVDDATAAATTINALAVSTDETPVGE
ncbi:MAG TPA: hypothetical protein K8V15_07440 [Tessaracoccus flavescens]|uniref:Uncharacterized protein n=1 Tax=Tessaracoccus flavescens TaxID=399497 RepID=A0A921EQQ7_9ACTN|nr:hypothetical protein [Tessaracoccus flavescens]